MTSTPSRTGTGRGAGLPEPAPAPGRLPRQRRWGLTAAGVALVVVCAVVAYVLVTTTGLTRSYLAVARNVPYGATISPDDLVVVDMSPAAGLQPIPADQRRHVVGKHAAADLFPGTLLTWVQLTDLAIPAPGQQLVGVELKPGQLPARQLKPQGREVKDVGRLSSRPWRPGVSTA